MFDNNFADAFSAFRDTQDRLAKKSGKSPADNKAEREAHERFVAEDNKRRAQEREAEDRKAKDLREAKKYYSEHPEEAEEIKKARAKPEQAAPSEKVKSRTEEEGKVWKAEHKKAYDKSHEDREARITQGKITGLSGKDLDDYISNPDLFEPVEQTEADAFFTPMKRKVITTVKPNGTTVKETLIDPSTVPSGSTMEAPAEPKKEVVRAEKVKQEFKSPMSPEQYEEWKTVSKKVDDAKKYRDNIVEQYKERRKELRAGKKDAKRGRDLSNLAGSVGGTTDYGLELMTKGTQVHDYNGKRKSVATGEELTPVKMKYIDTTEVTDENGNTKKVRNYEPYFVNEDGKLGERAAQGDYDRWKKGVKQGKQEDGITIKGDFEKVIKKMAFKKVCRDLMESMQFTEDELAKFKEKFKNENKALTNILDDDNWEYDWTPREEAFLNRYYTPIIEEGDESTQKRALFARTWESAEDRAIGSFETALAKMNVKAAKEDAKELNALKKKADDAHFKFIEDRDGKPRTATVYHGDGEWVGFEVNGGDGKGEGKKAKYMGRVEKDADGNKVFKVYAALSQPSAKKGDSWASSHSPDTFKNPVFVEQITADKNYNDVINDAKRAFEDRLDQMEGGYSNHKEALSKASDAFAADNYTGMSFIDYLVNELGTAAEREQLTELKKNNDDATAAVLMASAMFEKNKDADKRSLVSKTVTNGSLLKLRLEKLAARGLGVDDETGIIDTIENLGDRDRLTRIKNVMAEDSDMRNILSLEERGYTKQEDGTKKKVLKSDNTATKGNRKKGGLNNASYGEGSTVKDSKTGKYFGETARQARLDSLKKESKLPSSVLEALKGY